MLLYILLLLITVLACIGAGKNRYKEVICGALLIGLLATLCGLRGMDCGTDNINYYRLFTYKSYNGLEYAFKLSLDITPNFQLLLILYAFATYIILFFQLKKETIYICLGILVYMISTTKFFPESFNIIRQSLAASLMLWAFVSWNHSKRLETFLALLLAIMFHTSSAIAFPFLLLKKLRLPYYICALAVVVTVILGMSHIFNESLQLFALGAADYNSADSLADMANKYSSYGSGTSLLNSNAMFLSTVPITGIALITYPFSEEAKMKYGFYYNIFIFATILGNIFIPAMVYGFRIVFSLQIVQVLVIPLAFQFYRKKIEKQLIICSLILLSLIYLYYLKLLPVVGVRSIVPYQFFSDLQFIVDKIF